MTGIYALLTLAHPLWATAIAHQRNNEQTGIARMAETWLTYPQLAAHWQMSNEAARTRARRGRFPRRTGNGGQTEVMVDTDAPAPQARPPRAGGQSRTPAPAAHPDAETLPTATAKALEALEAHVATLRDQLGKAEAATAVERERVADLTAQLLRITRELLDARKVEAPRRSWWSRLVG